MYLKDHIDNTCCGCKACAEICPRGCISFVKNAEGFLYPKIDKTACIDCHMCERVCPASFDKFYTSVDGEALVGVHNSGDAVFQSSSGGAFTALCDVLLARGYVVCGVRFTKDFKVVHEFAATASECEPFRKSKYVLSDTNGCFGKVADILKGDGKVLFTGTPCQCAALRAYLDAKKIASDGLLVVDVVCHGVPSQYVFDKYIDELQKRENSSLVSYRFKNKLPVNNRINSRSAELVFENGKRYTVDQQSDAFLKGYYSRLFYRPSCGSCRFARPDRVSDITIGDAWSVEKLYPDWNPLSGVSLILLNSEKGRALAPELKCKMELRDTSVEWAVTHNKQLRVPTFMHPNRKLFFARLEKQGFHRACESTVKESILKRALRKAKRTLLGG